MSKLLATAACATLFILILPARIRAQDSIPHIRPVTSDPPAGPSYWSIDVSAAQLSLANVHYTDESTSELSIPRLTPAGPSAPL